MRKFPSSTKTLTYAVTSLAAVAALTACGSGGSTTTSAAAPSATSTAGGAPTGGAGAGRGGQRAFPGASGLIAAIDGKTMQVQSQTEQVAVVWNAKTAITTQVAGTAKDLKVGACVMASPARSAGSASAPSTASGAAGTVAAVTVRIMPAVDGQCTFGGGNRGGRGGGFPGVGQPPGGMPSDTPTDLPSAAATGGFPGGGGRRGAFGAFGTIASVGQGSFTVTTTGFPGANGASASPTTESVTYDSATTFTTSSTGKAADITVGECARAIGSADDTGTITATSLSLSPAENGTCTTGFGGPRQGNG